MALAAAAARRRGDALCLVWDSFGKDTCPYGPQAGFHAPPPLYETGSADLLREAWTPGAMVAHIARS